MRWDNDGQHIIDRLDIACFPGVKLLQAAHITASPTALRGLSSHSTLAVPSLDLPHIPSVSQLSNHCSTLPQAAEALGQTEFRVGADGEAATRKVEVQGCSLSTGVPLPGKHAG